MTSSEETREDLNPARTSRQLTSWVRRYAASRSMPILVGVAVLGLLFLGLGVLWYAAGEAYRSGSRTLFWLCIILLVPANLAAIWLIVPQWGWKRLERLAWRYYDDEGVVFPGHLPSRAFLKRYGPFVGLICAASMVTHISLGLAGYASKEHVIPVSALYNVPFLTVLFATHKSYVMLAWPALYATHALLVAAGAPVRIAGGFDELNILIPILGYGALVGAISHLFNRFAFARVKRLAGMCPTGKAGVEQRERTQDARS